MYDMEINFEIYNFSLLICFYITFQDMHADVSFTIVFTTVHLFFLSKREHPFSKTVLSKKKKKLLLNQQNKSKETINPES